MPVNPLPQPSPLIFFLFWVVVANYVVTKIARPSPLRIFFFLVPSAYRVHVVYLVFYVSMAAISKWYLIFMELLIPERNKVCAFCSYRNVVQLLPYEDDKVELQRKPLLC